MIFDKILVIQDWVVLIELASDLETLKRLLVGLHDVVELREGKADTRVAFVALKHRREPLDEKGRLGLAYLP